MKNDSLPKVWGNVIASSIWQTRRNTTTQQTSRCFCFSVFSVNFYLNLTIGVRTGTLGLRTLVEGRFLPLPSPEECFLSNIWGYICGVYWTDDERELFYSKKDLISHWNVSTLSLVPAVTIISYCFPYYTMISLTKFRDMTMSLCLQQQLQFTRIFIIDNLPSTTQQQLQMPKAIKGMHFTTKCRWIIDI